MATYEKDTDIERWEKDIKEAVGFSFESFRDKLTLHMRLPLCVLYFRLRGIRTNTEVLTLSLVRLRNVLGAYIDGRPFSLDLVGAVGLRNTKSFSRGAYDRAEQVLRQNAFTEKMHQLCWSQPGFFESKEEEIVLHHCVARYHAYV